MIPVIISIYPDSVYILHLRTQRLVWTFSNRQRLIVSSMTPAGDDDSMMVPNWMLRPAALLLLLLTSTQHSRAGESDGDDDEEHEAVYKELSKVFDHLEFEGDGAVRQTVLSFRSLSLCVSAVPCGPTALTRGPLQPAGSQRVCPARRRHERHGDPLPAR
eukprot:SAG22_NODE_130_length_18670_cov_12.091379_10_plen_160_part_00